jgi:hypothetical protein
MAPGNLLAQGDTAPKKVLRSANVITLQHGKLAHESVIFVVGISVK